MQRIRALSFQLSVRLFGNVGNTASTRPPLSWLLHYAVVEGNTASTRPLISAIRKAVG